MIGVGEVHQTCLCGSAYFDRVEVDRPDSSKYVTAFLACRRCGVMYHAPLRPEPSLPSQARGSFFIGQEVGARSSSTLSPDEHRELMEAVGRANKSKRKGLRGA